MSTLQYVGLVTKHAEAHQSSVRYLYKNEIHKNTSHVLLEITLKSTRRLRSPRGACGKQEHGKCVGGSSARVCFACDRPKDDAAALSSPPWRHIVDGPYWGG